MSRAHRLRRVYRITLHLGDELSMRMTAVAWAAYTRLRMTYLAEGRPLELVDSKLAAACRLSAGQWKRVRAEVLAQFRIIDGVLVHDECEAALTRKLRGNLRQDQVVREFEAARQTSSVTHTSAKKPEKSKAVGLRNGPCARPLSHKNQNPSCSFGVSDSGGVAAAGPPATTTQGLGMGRPPGAPSPEVDWQVSRVASLVRSKPPAPSRPRDGGMKQLAIALERLEKTVLARPG